MVGAPQIGQLGLFTNSKKDRRNHLKDHISFYAHPEDRTSSPQQRFNDAVLIAPLWLHMIAHGGCNAFHDVVFFVGLLVYPVDWNVCQGLIQETSVFVLGGCYRESKKKVSEFERAGILRWRWKDGYTPI